MGAYPVVLLGTTNEAMGVFFVAPLFPLDFFTLNCELVSNRKYKGMQP